MKKGFDKDNLIRLFFLKKLQIDPDKEELELHNIIGRNKTLSSDDFLNRVEK